MPKAKTTAKAKDGLPEQPDMKPPLGGVKPPPTIDGGPADKPDIDWNAVDLTSKVAATHVDAAGVDEITVVEETDGTVTFWPREKDKDGNHENYARVTMNRDNFEAHYKAL